MEHTNIVFIKWIVSYIKYLLRYWYIKNYSKYPGLGITLFISQWRNSPVTSALQTQSGPDRCKNVQSKEKKGRNGNRIKDSSWYKKPLKGNKIGWINGKEQNDEISKLTIWLHMFTFKETADYLKCWRNTLRFSASIGHRRHCSLRTPDLFVNYVANSKY